MDPVRLAFGSNSAKISCGNSSTNTRSLVKNHSACTLCTFSASTGGERAEQQDRRADHALHLHGRQRRPHQPLDAVPAQHRSRRQDRRAEAGASPRRRSPPDRAGRSTRGTALREQQRHRLGRRRLQPRDDVGRPRIGERRDAHQQRRHREGDRQHAGRASTVRARRAAMRHDSTR